MIYGRHEVGDIIVRAPMTEETTYVMAIETHDYLANGQTFTTCDPLTRAEVERLRDLCEEALR
jgi:hypothetical protein